MSNADGALRKIAFEFRLKNSMVVFARISSSNWYTLAPVYYNSFLEKLSEKNSLASGNRAGMVPLRDITKSRSMS